MSVSGPNCFCNASLTYPCTTCWHRQSAKYDASARAWRQGYRDAITGYPRNAIALCGVFADEYRSGYRQGISDASVGAES